MTHSTHQMLYMPGTVRGTNVCSKWLTHNGCPTLYAAATVRGMNTCSTVCISMHASQRCQPLESKGNVKVAHARHSQQDRLVQIISKHSQQQCSTCVCLQAWATSPMSPSSVYMSLSLPRLMPVQDANLFSTKKRKEKSLRREA